jgi:broad specificity phosphatase PhoE
VPTSWLLLIRHGRTHLNQQNVYAGWSEAPLDEAGREQAASLGRRLASVPLAAVYSSPLLRALQTAEAIVAGQPLKLEAREELAELKMAGWQGLGEREIAKRFPVEWQAWCRSPAALDCPHIESLSAAARRVRPLISEVARRHAGGAVAIVTHEAIVRLVVLISLGLDLHHYRSFRVMPGSLSILQWRPNGAQLVLLDDTSHHDGGRPEVLC